MFPPRLVPLIFSNLGPFVVLVLPLRHDVCMVANHSNKYFMPEKE